MHKKINNIKKMLSIDFKSPYDYVSVRSFIEPDWIPLKPNLVGGGGTHDTKIQTKRKSRACPTVKKRVLKSYTDAVDDDEENGNESDDSVDSVDSADFENALPPCDMCADQSITNDRSSARPNFARYYRTSIDYLVNPYESGTTPRIYHTCDKCKAYSEYTDGIFFRPRCQEIAYAGMPKYVPKRRNQEDVLKIIKFAGDCSKAEDGITNVVTIEDKEEPINDALDNDASDE